MEYETFRAMNTDILLGAEGDPQILAQGFRLVRSYIENCEQRFTRFSTESELATLNRSAGEWLSVSPDLFDLVSAAYDFQQETGGLFDPAILPALQQAGYDRSMDDLRRFGPAQPSTGWEWKRPDFRLTKFDPESNRLRLPVGVQIDLGGIAKGWIAEQAARRLAGWTNASVVNAGGDLFTVGLPKGETGWTVGIEDPHCPENPLAILRAPAGAVATSSVVRRSWEQNGRPRHHLIDPRTGEPAHTDWLSVTVIAPQAMVAEVYAKAILIAGSSRAMRLQERRPEIAFIGVRTDGTLWGSANSKEYLDVQPITA